MSEIYKIPDSMYDMALAFKKEKLWNQLADCNLFAVRHSDNTISYCSVMGLLGEHFALGVYHGADELDTLRRIPVDFYKMDEHEQFENQLAQKCLMLSFEGKEHVYPVIYREIREYCRRSGTVLRGTNAFPLFEKLRPDHIPWYVTDETDAMYLRECLEAAMSVSDTLKHNSKEALGFTDLIDEGTLVPMWTKDGDVYRIEKTELPPEADIAYPIGELNDADLEAKLKAVPKNHRTWAIHVFMSTNEIVPQNAPSEDEKTETNPAFYPFIMLIIDEQDETVLANSVSRYDGDDNESFISDFAETVLKSGLPDRIHVINPRTRSLLSGIGKKLKIKITYQAKNALIREVVDQLDAYLNDAMDDDEMMEELQNMLDIIKEPAMLRTIPDSVLHDLLQLQDYGMLTPEIIRILMAEQKRRSR
ncbi:MAG: DUF6930 domain-containing protein [Eubacteriales bacterium]